MSARTDRNYRGALARRARLASQVGTLLVFGMGFIESAHATAPWSVNSMCAFNMNGPQAFGLAQNSTIQTAWSTNQGASWGHQVLGGNAQDGLACASDGSNQGLVVFRDEFNSLSSMDRLSGWQLSYVTGGYQPNGEGLVLTRVMDQGKSKFVLFASAGGNIEMSVWDDTTNPKWSPMVVLPAPPSGISALAQADMAAYSVNIGLNGYVALISMFVVDDLGELLEYQVMLDGSPGWWMDWGTPTGERFSNARYFGPAASAVWGSTFQYPGTYAETAYSRQVVLPTADLVYTYAFVAPPGGNFAWKAIQTPAMVNLSGGFSRGCSAPNEPCEEAMTVAAVRPYYLVPSQNWDNQLWSWYSGPTDGNPPPVNPWSFSGAYLGPPIPALGYVWANWTVRGATFFIEGNHMWFADLDTQGDVTDLGTPM